MSKVSYSTITELPYSQVTRLQLEREYHRYYFGSTFCKNKDVLEIACGGGQGLGLLARNARMVVGADIESDNLSFALKTYKGRSDISLLKLDAQYLSFKDNSFDTILIYEAIYYLENPSFFLQEAKRLLRKSGVIVICSANVEWAGFNPSPFSKKYFSAIELSQLFEDAGLQYDLFGAFPDICDGMSDKLKAFIKKVAIKFNLIPKTMKAKKLLKRIFMGKLVTLPGELKAENIPYTPPVPLAPDKQDCIHTALFAVGMLK